MFYLRELHLAERLIPWRLVLVGPIAARLKTSTVDHHEISAYAKEVARLRRQCPVADVTHQRWSRWSSRSPATAKGIRYPRPRSQTPIDSRYLLRHGVGVLTGGLECD